jgi:hypothetical protein
MHVLTSRTAAGCVAAALGERCYDLNFRPAATDSLDEEVRCAGCLLRARDKCMLSRLLPA